MSKHQSLQELWWGCCLIAAPAISALSTFFWQDGEYGLIGGPILVLGCVLWIPAMTGLFNLLREKMPFYAVIGLWLAIYGCVGGAMFGAEGFFNIVYGITDAQSAQAYEAYPFGFNVLLFLPGPLFPLSLLILSIHLIRHKAVPLLVGLLLALGAAIFPFSRIPRIELIAYAADLVLFLPAAYIGWSYLRGLTANGTTQRNAIAR